MSKLRTLQPYILVLLAMIFWGMTFVWVKIALEAFRPATILLFRLSISSLLLWSFLIIFKKYQPLRREDIFLFLLSSLFQPFLYFVGETYGLSYVSSTLGAIIISTIPVFTPLGSWLFFRETLGWKNLFGFLFAFAGVILMVLGEESMGSTSVHGVLFLALAVVAAIANAITVKKLTVRYNSFMIVTFQNTIGILLFLPIFLVFDLPGLNEIPGDFRIWRNIVALAVFGSTLAFIFFTNSIKVLGINRSGIFSNLIPVFTALFAFLFLGENFPLIKLGGMAVVILGVMVVSFRKRMGKGFRLSVFR